MSKTATNAARRRQVSCKFRGYARDSPLFRGSRAAADASIIKPHYSLYVPEREEIDYRPGTLVIAARRSNAMVLTMMIPCCLMIFSGFALASPCEINRNYRNTDHNKPHNEMCFKGGDITFQRIFCIQQKGGKITYSYVQRLIEETLDSH
ncbi:hypothetical protein HJC23_002279 [Cyclotella cryptica]|uniref:Uncharacterized protein n=1 Tax=Cyclotella cryptica TaxID=29204 RepID=A0ABD3QI14_9STRA